MTPSIMTPSPRGVALALVLALGAIACNGGSSGTGAAGSGPTPSRPTPAPAASSDASAAAASAGGTAGAATPALPAIDVTCTTDGDCGVTDRQLDGDQRCCQGCGATTPARAAWIRRVDEICTASSDWMARCAPLACPVGVTRAVCRDAHCVLTP